MAGHSFPRSLAQEIPSCVQKCFIDGLVEAGCDEGDYDCWCSEKNHQVAAKTMNGCFFEDRIADGECTGRDVFTIDNVYQMICEEHGSSIGLDSSLPTIQYKRDVADTTRTLAKRGGGKLTVGQKAGIIVGSVLFSIICCFLLYFFLRRRAANKTASTTTTTTTTRTTPTTTTVSQRSAMNDQSAAEKGDATPRPTGKATWEMRSKMSSKLSGMTLQGSGEEQLETKSERAEGEKEKSKPKRTSLWRPSGEFGEVFKEELRKAEMEQAKREEAGN